ncbi:P-loop containing nucleoside triphosphate hydrolase protein [Thelephora terrestris]|uniref:P-loop containing nucleoside triphosphate hydrolase protein n=1 Tax=Thelephora terrestris TaxID=56493 RepID=A0A9P6HC61_9AGAM|nr:P-loop containing nucleoside triphosphate hydrolase protein [Thelephora terrestris]
MPSRPQGSRTSSVSSLSSFTTTPDSLMASPTPEPTPEPRGVGLSDPQQSEYRRRILGIIDRMRATGVGADMDLPMIAVIGSQSAGKSSLIESISGITLPRAAGTCTRCPTECRLSYSDQLWSCRVVLRKIVDSQGQPLGVAENAPFGPVITEKGDVEERIRRAQRAILNPSISPVAFLSGPDGEPDGRSELSFSKNCVCLELSGPDLTDLSFCDLPGLIVSVGHGGNDSDIELVRDLVKSYISRPSCLILLTVTCETDFENQGAHHMAKQYDPDGQRTIGVLTKPDRIPDGEEENWLRFIRDEAEHLANGWFAVKQPATADLRQGITWEEAREQERRFFLTTPPWSTERDYRHRFGTRNLTESLSNILSELIKRRLPELEVELRNLFEETESQLGKLPPEPSDDAQGEIILLVSNFARELAQYVEGTPDENGIHQQIRPFNATFLTAIWGTAQKFCPFVRGPAMLEGGENFTHPNFINSDVQPTISDQDEDAICLDEVKMMADVARAREFPGHTFFIVTKRLIKKSTEQWETPSHDLLGVVYDILSREANKMVDDHFQRFRYGRLHQNLKTIVNDVLDKCQASALEIISELLAMENKGPSTVHEPRLAFFKDGYLKAYCEARAARIRRLNPHLKKREDLIQALIAKDLAEHVPTLIYMANARAYFQLAFVRFTDLVPMMIDQELLRGLDWDRGLNSALTKGLGVTGPGSFERAKEYLQEPHDVKSRREGLLRKRERLLSAQRQLQSI